MNRVIKHVGVATVAALALAIAGVAQAGPHHHHARVGVWIGGPMWWGAPAYSSYYYGGYPYSQYVVERPVIVQQRADPVITVAPNAQANLWYYCADSRMYYPHVSQCASPWQEVPATPPR